MVILNRFQKKVLIIAGGSGGHIFPGVSVAQVLLKHGYNVVWLGAFDRMESKLVPLHGIEIKFIRIQGWRGTKIYKKIFLLFFLFLFSMYQSLKIIKHWNPSVVLSMGGYVAGPGSLISWLCGIPLLIHEQNRVVGITNRFLAFFAKKILQGFPNTIPNAITVGNPIRHSILSIPNPDSRWKSRTGPIRILVIGGSQGAEIFNEIVPKIAKNVFRKFIIWHQSGEKGFEKVLKAYKETHQNNNYYKIDSFINNIDQAYSWADLVISRSGALTVSEIACVGLPAIFVPFMHHKDCQQFFNADPMVQVGAAKIIKEKMFTVNHVSEILGSLDRIQLLKMAKRAKILAIPNSTQLIVNMVIKELKN